MVLRIVGLCGCKIVEVRLREGCCRMHVLSVMKNMGAFKYVGVRCVGEYGYERYWRTSMWV